MMQIVNLSHNDSLESIVQKCNLNFKELVFSTNQHIKKQSRLDGIATQEAIDIAMQGFVPITVQQVHEITGIQQDSSI